MRIVHKLLALVALAALSIALLTAVNYSKFMTVQVEATDITDNVLPSVAVLANAELEFANIRRYVLLHLIEPDLNKKQQIEEQFKTSVKNLNDGLKSYEPLVVDDTDRKNLEAARSELALYLPMAQEILDLSSQNMLDSARELVNGKGAAQADKVFVALDTAVKYNNTLTETSKKHIASAITSAISLSIGLGLVLLLAICAIGWLIARSITSPLAGMQKFVTELSQDYNFTRRVEVRNRDEIGESLLALNALLDSLQQSIRQLNQVGVQVSGSVGNLSTTSKEMSQSAHGVSSAASSMAAGIEEVTVSISHVADRAQECDHTAREAGRLAASGGAVIESTINNINQIAEQVRQSASQIESLKERTANINSVVNVIKEIADQTNLLALNAAIEAARAGELGRGFAVVADEVRKLAERTGSSTQEIISTVSAIQNEANSTVHTMQQTVRQVDEGVARAQEASAAIREIRQSTDTVVDQVSEISGAMREQSSASSAMAQQVERVAQMSEESSAAAASTADEGSRLQRLGQELDQAIARYKV
ncbi:methyl-accepting chemotaxis protein [Chitinilyticum aquatile]|uniref:methyl-accepting chemotaxis protein n=1 Tax=Chitinilyticum aquatile TaxID=362520 RepID=UPI0004065FD4|nr:methyl-accepting chemotaxis protein [Chitinilyticum aquatile]